MLRAVGFQDADFSKPQIGIASTWANVTPCNMHIGELAREHQKGTERLRYVSKAVARVLAGGEMLRQDIDAIVRDFLQHERHHIAMEDSDFFPAAVKALTPADWAEISTMLSPHKDPLFSDATETRFDALRAHIMELEEETEAGRHATSSR